MDYESEAMNAKDALEKGRRAVTRQAWGDAYSALAAADKATSLGVEDLERLAIAAYMTGQDHECAKAWTRAHHEYIRVSDPLRAARCAFWQACGLLFKGEIAPATGWIARGRRMLDQCPDDCAERAWLLVLSGLPVMFEGDPAAALTYFAQATEIIDRVERDPDVQALALLAQGAALVSLGETTEGLPLLDEAMVAVTSGEVSPIVSGIAYCQMIAVCHEIFDLRRAREWTTALTDWCDSQQDIVAYRGDCLIHRCEILQLQGDVPAAMDAAEQACEWLADSVAPDILGSAYYHRAEGHRLRGELAEAEENYRSASQSGRDPEPGMSLLRLALRKFELAAASIQRALDESHGDASHARILPHYVEVMLASGRLNEARAGADRLAGIAAALDAPFVEAAAGQATGAVLIAEGDARSALDPLRRAWRTWQSIGVPYQAARVRVLLALACRDLKDDDTAAMELDAARLAFQELGATYDLAELEKRLPKRTAATPGGLTPREAEVLALLATGKTNREIAEVLSVSEHTVARHVQNIFAKLGVTSRTAASAFAFEHDLA